jgi:hypothetical protein
LFEWFVTNKIGTRATLEKGFGARSALCYVSVMSRFDELLAAMKEPGEDGLPETIYDDLSSEYALLSENSGAKVAELESMLQEKESEISRLKAMNYDLLVAAPANEEPVDEGSDDTDDEESDGIDSLFESETD